MPTSAKIVSGAPDQGTQASRVAVMMSSAPAALAGLHGGVAIGTTDRVVEATLPDGALVDVPAVDDKGEDLKLGAVHHIARRADGSVIVAADAGLLVDEDGLLLASPLAGAIDGKKALALDARGAGKDEELWITEPDALLFVAGGTIETIAIEGAPKAELAIAAGPSKALVLAGGEAHVVDVAAKTSVKIATGLGVAHGADHGDDGAAFVATDGGLLELAVNGDATLRTLAADGATAEPVLGVSAAFGELLVLTKSALVQIDAKGPHAIANVKSPIAIATDADGDAWVADASGLGRFQTGSPVSFDTDVVPFMNKHCQSCHANGSQGAPKHDFTDYDTTKKYADAIVKKLAAPAGMGVMPPANIEKLTPEDYAVVTRWVASGQPR